MLHSQSNIYDPNKSMISKVREYPDFDKSIEYKSNIASRILKKEPEDTAIISEESNGVSSNN